MKARNFFAELKRRNVYKVAITYLRGLASEGQLFNSVYAMEKAIGFYEKVEAASTYADLLSQAYAVLGDKNSALNEAQRAIALKPSAEYALDGPGMEENLALIQTIIGENSGAISTLARLLELPYVRPITPALLRLDPTWDPLRADPAFQKLCEEKPH